MMVEGMLYRMGLAVRDVTYRQYLVIGIPYIKNLTAGLRKTN